MNRAPCIFILKCLYEQSTYEKKFEPAQLRSPQLSKTQMLPSRSTSTAEVDPHFLLSGSSAQPSSTQYGLSCAYAPAPGIAITTIAATRATIIEHPWQIMIIPSLRSLTKACPGRMIGNCFSRAGTERI